MYYARHGLEVETLCLVVGVFTFQLITNIY